MASAGQLVACGDDDEWPCVGAAGGGGGDAPPARQPVVPLLSRAEVKFALLDSLPTFRRPALPTDLRPAGTVPLWSPGPTRQQQPHWRWQHPDFQWETPLTHAPELSSFSIAGRSMDCLDGVDVISDGDNIKKLLKLAYNSQQEISMMVHRVGRLLLLDEFDITKHLLETEASEWVWLERLLREHFLSKFEDADWARRAAAQEEAEVVDSQSADLYWQLLQHSARALPPPPPPPLLALPAPGQVPSRDPPAPRRPGRHRAHYFTRNMLWTFQDLKMLIGTEMPILGGGTHPCVSLRLHDMSEPINVLTGLDYWLDNLMSNVPEVLMCYHVDGVLKNYSLLKTEELPRLPNSSFEPRVVHDVAENILAFLRENATKTGHTYWLFKGDDDDCVKLYDLTSLMEEHFENVGRDANPFTGPVALLLYRIACNMLRNRHVVDYGDRLGTVHTILDKTLELIDSDPYLQVRANIHMMLADCYVPRDHRPLATHFSRPPAPAPAPPSPERAPAPASPWTQQPMVRVDLLGRKGAVRAPAGGTCGWAGELRPRPISGDARERTERALEHVLSALDCMRRRETLERDEKTPKMARPCQAIPMPYCPLSSSLDPVASTPPPPQPLPDPEPEPPPAAGEWGDVTETLLLQKAAHLCAVRAAADAERGRTTAALQGAQAALCCVRAAGGSQQVPEVTAAAAILASDALLTLSRAPHAEMMNTRRRWLSSHEHLCRRLVDTLAARSAYEVPAFVNRPEQRRPVSDPAQGLDPDARQAHQGANPGPAQGPHPPPGQGQQGPAPDAALGPDRDAGAGLELRQPALALLHDCADLLQTAAPLQLSQEMRGHVRARQGLVQNELGLQHSSLLEDILVVLHQTCTKPGDTEQSGCCGTAALRSTVADSQRAAEAAFAKAVTLLEGPQRGAAEMNLGHLHNRVAALHGLWGDVSASLQALERAAAAYCRAAAAVTGPQPQAAERAAAAVGCRDFAARMALLRSGIGYRMARLHIQLPSAAAVSSSSCSVTSPADLLRRALTLCDPGPADAPFSADERRDVCFHAAEVLSMLAKLHSNQASSRSSARRRGEQLREALELYGRAAGMYRQAGRPDALLAAMREQADIGETLVIDCTHWHGRLRLVQEVLTSAAAVAAAPLSPLCSHTGEEVAAAAERQAMLLLSALLLALKTICSLLRKYGSAAKRRAPAHYEDLYRRALASSLRTEPALQRLDCLLTMIRDQHTPANQAQPHPAEASTEAHTQPAESQTRPAEASTETQAHPAVASTEAPAPATEAQPPDTDAHPPDTEAYPPATETHPLDTEAPPATEAQPPANEAHPPATEAQAPDIEASTEARAGQKPAKAAGAGTRAPGKEATLTSGS